MSEAVELFTTSILSHPVVRGRHERYMSVLSVLQIPFIVHDLASDPDAKSRWRRKAVDAQIPGLLVNNEWRGTFAEFEEAVEFGEVRQFLGIAEGAASAPKQHAAPAAKAAKAAPADKPRPGKLPMARLAPPGSGVRAEPDADEMLFNLLPPGTTVTESQVDELLKELEKPLQRTPRRTYVPSNRGGPLPLANMGEHKGPAPTARFSDSRNLVEEAAKAIGVDAPPRGAVPRVRVNRKPLHEIMAERRRRYAAMENSQKNDELFESLGITNVKLSDAQVEEFLNEGKIPILEPSQPAEDTSSSHASSASAVPAADAAQEDVSIAGPAAEEGDDKAASASEETGDASELGEERGTVGAESTAGAKDGAIESGAGATDADAIERAADAKDGAVESITDAKDVDAIESAADAKDADAAKDVQDVVNAAAGDGHTDAGPLDSKSVDKPAAVDAREADTAVSSDPQNTADVHEDDKAVDMNESVAQAVEEATSNDVEVEDTSNAAIETSGADATTKDTEDIDTDAASGVDATTKGTEDVENDAASGVDATAADTAEHAGATNDTESAHSDSVRESVGTKESVGANEPVDSNEPVGANEPVDVAESVDVTETDEAKESMAASATDGVGPESESAIGTRAPETDDTKESLDAIESVDAKASTAESTDRNVPESVTTEAVESVDTPDTEGAAKSADVTETATKSVGATEIEDAVKPIDAPETENGAAPVDAPEPEVAVKSVDAPEMEESLGTADTRQTEDAVDREGIPDPKDSAASADAPQTEDAVESADVPQIDGAVAPADAAQTEDSVASADSPQTDALTEASPQDDATAAAKDTAITKPPPAAVDSAETVPPATDSNDAPATAAADTAAPLNSATTNTSTLADVSARNDSTEAPSNELDKPLEHVPESADSSVPAVERDAAIDTEAAQAHPASHDDAAPSDDKFPHENPGIQREAEDKQQYTEQTANVPAQGAPKEHSGNVPSISHGVLGVVAAKSDAAKPVLSTAGPESALLDAIETADGDLGSTSHGAGEVAKSVQNAEEAEKDQDSQGVPDQHDSAPQETEQSAEDAAQSLHLTKPETTLESGGDEATRTFEAQESVNEAAVVADACANEVTIPEDASAKEATVVEDSSANEVTIPEDASAKDVTITGDTSANESALTEDATINEDAIAEEASIEKDAVAAETNVEEATSVEATDAEKVATDREAADDTNAAVEVEKTPVDAAAADTTPTDTPPDAAAADTTPTDAPPDAAAADTTPTDAPPVDAAATDTTAKDSASVHGDGKGALDAVDIYGKEPSIARDTPGIYATSVAKNVADEPSGSDAKVELDGAERPTDDTAQKQARDVQGDPARSASNAREPPLPARGTSTNTQLPRTNSRYPPATMRRVQVTSIERRRITIEGNGSARTSPASSDKGLPETKESAAESEAAVQASTSKEPEHVANSLELTLDSTKPERLEEPDTARRGHRKTLSAILREADEILQEWS
ncbi:hypothetical protein MCUN1_003946 [Malassezia cuniculi]|uniref:Uncharacterized protein n=1 Tax=Malassezia cuniculi TaxID=948313 RepID=A0AAF0EZ11_9BASI|nr:hypothetical protein MCUN1_003946 [Malassezia cuniculi]